MASKGLQRSPNKNVILWVVTVTEIGLGEASQQSPIYILLTYIIKLAIKFWIAISFFQST